MVFTLHDWKLSRGQSTSQCSNNFTVLCWASFMAILRCMWPVGHGLDTPGRDALEETREQKSERLSHTVAEPNILSGIVLWMSF